MKINSFSLFKQKNRIRLEENDSTENTRGNKVNEATLNGDPQKECCSILVAHTVNERDIRYFRRSIEKVIQLSNDEFGI